MKNEASIFDESNYTSLFWNKMFERAWQFI